MNQLLKTCLVGALPFLMFAAEAATYAVNPVTGVDEPGSPVYRTLTFALAQHGGNANYELAAGVYGAASGEVFPIRLEGLSGVGITGVGGQAVFDAAGANVRTFLVLNSYNVGFTNLTMTGSSVSYDANVTGQQTGSVSLTDSSAVSFSNCTICGNSAGKSSGSNVDIYGAGVSIFSCEDVRFVGCRISENTMGNNNWGRMLGAGVALWWSKEVTFDGTEFVGNRCEGGSLSDKGFSFYGAVVYSMGGRFNYDYVMTFSNCLFRDNCIATPGNGEQSGACVALQNKSGGGFPTANFYRCTFLENIGEPIVNQNSKAFASECVFVGNSMESLGTVEYENCSQEMGTEYGYRDAAGNEPQPTAPEHWYVSPMGSDDNAGQDASQPLRTLGGAFARLKNNATVHVAPGVYDATAGETFPLRLNRLLNVMVIGEGASPVIDAGGTARVLDVFGCHGLRLENLSVTGGKVLKGAAAEEGGSVRLLGSRCVLHACSLTNNQAATEWSKGTIQGGGLYARGATTSVILDGCLVADNDIVETGGRGGYGLGLAVESIASLQISNSVIRANGTQGTVKTRGGGIYADSVARFGVFNSLIAGNCAAEGGAAVYIKSASCELVNCTIADNVATKDAINSESANKSVSIVNSILSNTGKETNGVMTVSHTLVRGGTEDAANGVITGDPRFRAPQKGDYRLRAGSPCIDVGVAFDWMRTATDLKGDPRLRCGRVDLGCYECPPGGLMLLVR